MELDYIREFVVLVKVGNFLRASDGLFISQSSLSQHIKRLEGQLGEKLLDRSVQPVRLTEFGKVFYPYAEKLVNIDEECSRELSRFTESSSRVLRIGSRILDCYDIISCIIDFRNSRPDIRLFFMENRTAELINAVKAKQCDVAIVRQKEKTNEGLETFTFYEDPLVLIVPAAHPFSKAQSIRLRELKDDTFIIVQDEKNTNLVNGLCRDMCHEAGFDPKLKVSGDGARTVVNMVQCGMGVGILSREMILTTENISIVELEEKKSLYVNFLFGKRLKKGSPGKAFLDYMKEQYG